VAGGESDRRARAAFAPSAGRVIPESFRPLIGRTGRSPRQGPILFERVDLPFVFRGPETAGTRTRPGQMHPQEAQAKPQAENALHDAAAVIAGEKVSRETVPHDSRESRVLVVPPPHRDAGGTWSLDDAAN